MNSLTIPGLFWLDEEKTMFRVPWKHPGKQDWSPEQCTILKVSSLVMPALYMYYLRNGFSQLATGWPQICIKVDVLAKIQASGQILTKTLGE